MHKTDPIEQDSAYNRQKRRGSWRRYGL